jgi:hypothetical protein
MHPFLTGVGLAVAIAAANPATPVPVDGKGRRFTAYVGSYLNLSRGKSFWWDIAYARGNLYISSHGGVDTTCGLAESDVEGIRVVDGDPRAYDDKKWLGKAFGTDVFDWLTPQGQGLKDVVPQMGCQRCDIVSYFKRVSIRPNLNHMWYVDSDGKKRTCAPK